jgi:hypothetical protein
MRRGGAGPQPTKLPALVEGMVAELFKEARELGEATTITWVKKLAASFGENPLWAPSDGWFRRFRQRVRINFGTHVTKRPPSTRKVKEQSEADLITAVQETMTAVVTDRVCIGIFRARKTWSTY